MLPISIELRPSRQILWWMVVAHAFSLLVVLFLPLDFLWRGMLILAILLSAWAARKSLLAVDVERVVLKRHGECLIGKVGAGETAVLTWYAPFSTYLTVVELVGARRYWLVLLPDSSDAESLRRLRVWLKTSA